MTGIEVSSDSPPGFRFSSEEGFRHNSGTLGFYLALMRSVTDCENLVT
jgi:hypothetical protein